MIFHQLLRTCHHTQRLISVVTCHVFVVDIIMFIKRFVVSQHCIFGMNLYYVCRDWVMVGAMLGNGWHKVG